jgi:hypothetical protein
LVLKCRQRLHLVAGLDLLDVLKVVGAKQLGAVSNQHQVGVRLDDFVDLRGFLTFQPGPASRYLPPPLPVVRLPM